MSLMTDPWEKEIIELKKEKKILINALESLKNTALYKKDNDWYMTNFTKEQFLGFIENTLNSVKKD